MSDSSKTWHFHGGLHLPGHKDISTHRAITRAFIPTRLVIPLQQHIGEPSEVIVEKGDHVLKGQMLARANGYVSVPAHAPTSGTVVEITEQSVPHPSGMSATCIILKPDGEDLWMDLPKPSTNYQDLNPSALRNRIRESGIVGLGGAGFPAFIKLNPGARTAVDILILNAAECEPYITCDDMLIRQHPIDVIEGMEIMRHSLQAKRCIIGIEDNKPEAYHALKTAIERSGYSHMELRQVPTKYPAGGEKQLIKTLTGKEVPSNGLPLDIGIVCHNVGTAASVYKAIFHSEPLISRIVTVTGNGVHQQGNHEVLIGTPIDELIEHCGGYSDDLERLIMGGPMMGFTLHTDSVPIIKTSNCVLAAGKNEVSESHQAMPCIRCGACAEACPAELLPQQLYWYAHSKDFDKIQDYHLFDCIECGCCAYVCPSQIPLVQYYRYAKTEIWEQEREKQKSDRARKRHEFRLERLEREKREREERMRKKKAALAKNKETDKEDPKKAAIEAALARVKQKQQSGDTGPKNVENLTEEQKRKIAEVDARREKMKQDKNPDKQTGAE
jgi:electron transport complex protein RnfC